MCLISRIILALFLPCSRDGSWPSPGNPVASIALSRAYLGPSFLPHTRAVYCGVGAPPTRRALSQSDQSAEPTTMISDWFSHCPSSGISRMDDDDGVLPEH